MTIYVWDEFNIIAEMCDVGYTNWYTYGLDMSGTLQRAGGVGGLLAMTRDTGTATNTYLYCFDGNGNVVNLVDASDGSIAAAYAYSPFGSLIRSSGVVSGDNPVRWSTKHTDDETDFVMYELRPYSPELGRFVNRDPLQERGGGNLYAFVANNPLEALDFLGLLKIWHDSTGKEVCRTQRWWPFTTKYIQGPNGNIKFNGTRYWKVWKHDRGQLPGDYNGGCVRVSP